MSWHQKKDLTISSKYQILYLLEVIYMIKPHMLLVDELREYASPRAKITRLLDKKKLIQVKRGLFLAEEDKDFSLNSLSAIIYGPSYVSFASALSFYNLIPERVMGITCATYGKNKNREFHTAIGDFYYYYLPRAVYPYEIEIREENGQNFLIATPEKAICDSLYKTHGIDTEAELEELLLFDWRIDKEAFAGLNLEVISNIVPFYNKKTCQLLLDWLQKESTR
jgi:predicted transcriptional regulator of viral defense system